ncbi:MAG: SUMF1/EgtB/PvdO family nonheme iron enzyme [Planctomycetes bacterium]|nr:SUMF1/EgtB/PvdO family nonheme iron enzyme [Planctomycetota bacterium]
MNTTTSFAFLSLAVCCASAVQAVEFDWAIIGNPGNAADTEVANDGTVGYGSVDYTYRISKTEVTNAQYTEFLNAVAKMDTNSLYSTSMGSSTLGGIIRSGLPGFFTYNVKPDAAGQGPGGSDYAYSDKPVAFVSFFNATRFVNWLENGQPSGAQGVGTTEVGVYTIGDGVSETRAPSASFFLPSEDEWYKAAYHDATAGTAGTYFDYPTTTDFLPNNNLPDADTGNSANYGLTNASLSYPLTDVGAYTLSQSSYGTFDQGGNAWEWTEAVIDGTFRALRGGAWGYSPINLAAATRVNFATLPGMEFGEQGFRVASIPEPSTLLLGAMATVGLLMRRRWSS